MASNVRTVTEVDEVREERLRRRERDRLRRERETNEERCARFVSIMPRGNEKHTCTITISFYYRAVAAIFIARIYSIIYYAGQL